MMEIGIAAIAAGIVVSVLGGIISLWPTAFMNDDEIHSVAFGGYPGLDPEANKGTPQWRSVWQQVKAARMALACVVFGTALEITGLTLQLYAIYY